MKIDKPSNTLPAASIAEGKPRTVSKGKSNPSPAAQQSDSVSVSLGSTSTQLHAMASLPVVDAGKVAEIKQAISDGRFKVNPEIVADRLIETVRDLIGKRA
ncbi:MAG: flagellar biosynthesis anti-sigma factor FlgM [Candidatus Nitrotoga sp.]